MLYIIRLTKIIHHQILSARAIIICFQFILFCKNCRIVFGNYLGILIYLVNNIRNIYIISILLVVVGANIIIYKIMIFWCFFYILEY